MRIGISLPITATTVSPDERQDLRKDLTAATGLEASDVIRVAKYDWGGKSAVVQLDSETELAGLHVDPKALVSWRAGWDRVAWSWPGLRVVSRSIRPVHRFLFPGERCC